MVTVQEPDPQLPLAQLEWVYVPVFIDTWVDQPDPRPVVTVNTVGGIL
jgi:hypothetical protein